VPDEKGMKAFMYQDGWVVLKSSKQKKAAKDYLNFFISPENNEAFNQMLGQGTTNRKSKASGFAENIAFKGDELAKYAYFPNFTVLAAQLNDTVKRFETEIVPLL
jgi:putative spermidine/putrescine transport system substrate-binding protein